LDIILQDGFLDNVKKISEYFDQELISLKKKYSKVVLEVRGRGLLKGLKLAVDNAKFIETLMKYKMLVVKAEEQVIRLFPALIVSKKEINEAISKIEQACKEYNN
jgi:acetylornithine/N-succinyldiaminopimelate aminotransferase